MTTTRRDTTPEAEPAPGDSLATVPQEAGVLAVVQREDTEIKAAMVLARQFPRDENSAYTAIMRTCSRPAFAEKARYVYPRGGKTISGPSVKLARTMAQSWGNIRFGLRIVSLDKEWGHIRGHAYDVETNTMVEMEDKFQLLIERVVKDGPPNAPKRSEWVAPDERELRELVNRRGAICVRNAILQLLPFDFVDSAVKTAEETVRAAAKGTLKQSREESIRSLALAFQGLGVSVEMLTERLKHDLELIDEDELTELRGIYAALYDGQSKRSDYFTFAPVRSRGRSELNERIDEATAQEAPDVE